MPFSHVRDDGTALIRYPDPHAREVRVTGSFCDWRTPGEALGRAAHGFAGVVGPLPGGDVEYKLVVDGRWVADPTNLASGRDGNSLLRNGSPHGGLHVGRFHAPALGEERGYAVYLPPGYAASTRRLPVLYLLHGALDWERTWLEKGALATTLDRLRSTGAIGELIVVMPADNGGLFHGDTRVADYLARDLVGHVDAELRTLASPRHRALDGLSTGGFTSVLVGAWRTDTWRSIGSMSGCHDARSFEAIRTGAPAMRQADQRYLVSCGSDEPQLGTCREVCRALDAAGVPNAWHEAPGAHEWPTWRAALERHVRFHWEHIAG
ncbi:MAG: hypothetical protein IT373_09430 [Polyangiaceae bacterium]|nr:hypothetical protein [Polyangiaceae bacterium]